MDLAFCFDLSLRLNLHLIYNFISRSLQVFGLNLSNVSKEEIEMIKNLISMRSVLTFTCYQETGFKVTVNPLPKSILYVKDWSVRVKEREHKVWTRNFTQNSVITCTLTFDLETWLKITANSLQKALCG